MPEGDKTTSDFGESEESELPNARRELSKNLLLLVIGSLTLVFGLLIFFVIQDYDLFPLALIMVAAGGALINAYLILAAIRYKKSFSSIPDLDLGDDKDEEENE